MSDIESSAKEMGIVLKSFLAGPPYKGVSYSNLQLYGPDMSERVDPNCLIKNDTISIFWPSGIPHLESIRFGTYLLNRDTSKPDYSKVSQVRTTLLSLDLSKRALRRWAGIKGDHAEVSGYPMTQTDDTMIPRECELNEVPFAGVILSEVISHRWIKAGQMVAHLGFPSAMNNPRLALMELQNAQRITIAKEQS